MGFASARRITAFLGLGIALLVLTAVLRAAPATDLKPSHSLQLGVAAVVI